jgi:hypothetical protein
MGPVVFTLTVTQIVPMHAMRKSNACLVTEIDTSGGLLQLARVGGPLIEFNYSTSIGSSTTDLETDVPVKPVCLRGCRPRRLARLREAAMTKGEFGTWIFQKSLERTS